MEQIREAMSDRLLARMEMEMAYGINFFDKSPEIQKVVVLTEALKQCMVERYGPCQ
jgi:hypothetical protein